MLKADEYYLKLADSTMERSGSCAIIVLIVEDIIYVANIGDSRAVLSTCTGSKSIQLSKDHKP